MNEMGTELRTQGGMFVTTHWSVVLDAGDPTSPTAAVAMQELCRSYWFPIYAHLRRRGMSAAEAEDLTQDFFASLLRHDSLASVRRERGRFRSFLLTSLKYFLADQSDRARATKRGGGEKPIELDSLSAEERLSLEPACHDTPERAFDRHWAATLVQHALEGLQAEQHAAGRGRQFELLKCFLEHETSPGEYEQLSPELGLSPNAIAAAVRRLRLRLRDFLVSEAMRTVATPTEAEAELRTLFD